MTACPALYTETVWLREPDYTVIPLNSKLDGYVQTLSQSLNSGIAAYPDAGHEGFYEAQIGATWHYIHVHDEARTIYLVAVSDARL